MKIQKIKNFLKKFFASITLAIFTMGIFIPTTHAAHNPRYDFSRTGWEPVILPFIPPIEYHGAKFEKEIIMDVNSAYMQHISLMYAPVVEKYKNTNLIQSDFNALYLYIKPELLKHNPIILFNKNAEVVEYKDGQYIPLNDWLFVDSIFYDEKNKKIKIAGGGGKYANGQTWMYNEAIIAENVDENTPDFMIFVQIQQMYMKNTDGTIRMNSRYLIFRETELGNWEMITSSDAIDFTTSSPINRVTPSYFHTKNNAVIPVKIKHNEFINFCYENSGNSINEKYYLCTESLQPLIMNIYSYIWQNQFGLKVIEWNWEIFDEHWLWDKYETIPPFGNWFKGAEYEKCEALEIWCHTRNLWKAIYNGIGSIFSPVINWIKNIWNWFADVIKWIFTWAWEKISWFFEPIVKPIWEEIQNLYKEIEDFFKKVFEIITNLFKPWSDPTTQTPSATQKLLCDTDAILQNKENIEQNEGIFWVVFNTLKAGFGIFGIIDPIAPVHGSQLCTYEGIKTLKLRENSFIDIILFLIFGSSLFLLFYRKS